MNKKMLEILDILAEEARRNKWEKAERFENLVAELKIPEKVVGDMIAGPEDITQGNCVI